MRFRWLRNFRSYRLFSSKRGPPIPKGKSGSLLATTLLGLGWTPEQPVFDFIHARDISGRVSELYIYGEKSSLQHEYTVLRVDIHDQTSWLRIDWTGDITQATSFGTSEGGGAVVLNISLDKDVLILPRDKQIVHEEVSVPLGIVAGIVMQLSKTPYHLIRWNCIQFTLELRRMIQEATQTNAWQTAIIHTSMQVAAGSIPIEP